MKLASRVILLNLFEDSPTMQKIKQASVELEKKRLGSVSTRAILPIVYADLMDAKKKNYSLKNKETSKLDDDIIRLKNLMAKLKIPIPRTSI